MTAAAAGVVVLVTSLLGRGEGGAAWRELGRLLDAEPGRAADGEIRFALELLALARCQGRRESDPLPKQPSVWDLARAHTALERMRLASPPVWARRLRWAPEIPAGAVVWPADSERWSGEEPVVAAPETRCNRSLAPAAPQVRARAVGALLGALPAGAPTRDALALELASLELGLGEPARAERALRQAGEAGLTAEERRDRGLVLAIAAADEGRDTAADWARLRRADAPDAYLDAALVAAALRQGDLAAAALARPVAEARAAESDWFASRAALLSLRLGDEAAFLALGRRLLGARPRAEVVREPLLFEVSAQVAAQLATHPFGEPVVEIAESLGPPAELSDRLDAAAQAALGAGRPAFAREAYRWLGARETSPARRLRYRSRLCAALLASGETRAFLALYRQIAGAAGASPAPAEPGRADAERALVRATRDALPWLRDPAAHSILAEVVALLQRHLRAPAERPSRTVSELTELYRIASATLPLSRGARPYAEKLGARRAPVLLGEIAVPTPPLTVPPPSLPPPAVRGARSLLCLPEGERCRRWDGPSPTPAAGAHAVLEARP